MIAQAKTTRTGGPARQATQKASPPLNHRPAWHNRFLRLVPAISRQAANYLRGLQHSEREEALEEVVAHAFVAYARLVELGKEDLAYATPLARFAAIQYRAGRRVGVKSNCRDVLSNACRRRHRLAIERLDRFDQRSGTWQEVAVEDKHFTPADAAAMRLDFADWLASLSERNSRLAERLAMGETTSGASRLFRISRGRVSQLRRELYDSWRLFQGEPSANNA